MRIVYAPYYCSAMCLSVLRSDWSPIGWMKMGKGFQHLMQLPQNNGSAVNMFLDPDTPWRVDDINRGYVVHTAENLVHELGHVLVFKNGKDLSGLYLEWGNIWTLINDFDTPEGWSAANFAKLQNRSQLSDLNGFQRNELEHERVANMFEAFVMDYRPETKSIDERESRAAWAMWTFMSGQCPPEEVHIDLTGQEHPCGHGFAYWLQEYS